jgi:RNA polymerase sigma-70 factor (ECF subfamily)
MTHAQTIAQYQPLLQQIAYNLVRCKEDAEDIVQETFVKWLHLEKEKIENTRAYLVKAVTNSCLNHLNTLRRKKETCLHSLHVPEFLHRVKDMHLPHLDWEVTLPEAFRVLLTKLEPLERSVFILKEVFDWDYHEVQATLNKKKEHCRQLLCRAKKKLQEERSRLLPLASGQHLVESFRKASATGRLENLLRDLHLTDSATSEKKPA